MSKTSIRRKEILRCMAATGAVRVDDLAAALEVGPATVRRDLNGLAAAGRVVRTYGGACLPGPAVRPSSDDDPKRLIAHRAAALVEDGESIIITSGTTTLALARALVERQNLTVITNALDIVQVLIDRPGIEIVVLGGTVRPRMHSLLGHLTALCAREVRANWLMMGASAVHPVHGLMNDYPPEILTDRVLQDVATNVCVLADATKLGRVSSGFVFPITRLHTLVTDARAGSDMTARLEAKGVRVLIADDEPRP